MVAEPHNNPGRLIMKRIKLKNGYHDARIREVRFIDDCDIMLDVDLCSCCNASPGPATLCFLGIRNYSAVKDELETARAKNAKRGYIDEIIAILRADNRGFIIGLDSAGDLWVDAKGLTEA